MNYIIKIKNTFEKILDKISVMLLVIVVLFVAFQVVFRFINVSAPWTEEFARLAYVLVTFFGSVLAISEGKHISVAILLNKMKPKQRKVVQIFISLLVSGLLIIVIYGLSLTIKISKVVSTSALPWFKMNNIYISVMIACIIMLIYEMGNIFVHFKSQDK